MSKRARATCSATGEPAFLQRRANDNAFTEDEDPSSVNDDERIEDESYDGVADRQQPADESLRYDILLKIAREMPHWKHGSVSFEADAV